MLGICIPARDRDVFLQIGLLRLPEASGGGKLYIGVQSPGGDYNAGLSRNYAAKLALDDGCTHLAFLNVDTIPLQDVQFLGIDCTWFLSAGGARVSSELFVAAHGWPNDYVGWGYEDSEFGTRLAVAQRIPRVPRWCDLREAETARLWDLELTLSHGDTAERFSTRYWYGDLARPRYPLILPWPIPIQRPAKTWHDTRLIARNRTRSDRFNELSELAKKTHMEGNGIGQIDLATARVERGERASFVHFNV